MFGIFDSPYIIELLTPRRGSDDMKTRVESFAERYFRVLDAGAVVSIPDNPMGSLHLTAVEAMDTLGLSLHPERTLLHLTGRHARTSAASFLRDAAARGLTRLLIVGGDRNTTSPELQNEAGTSVELLKYIGREFPDTFTCGVAFNQYRASAAERELLRRKADAGARFVITQPVIGEDAAVAGLGDFTLPVFAGVWMSQRTDLLLRCVGLPDRHELKYDAVHNLEVLERAYPDYGLYLSLLSFRRTWSTLLTRFPRRVAVESQAS